MNRQFAQRKMTGGNSGHRHHDFRPPVPSKVEHVPTHDASTGDINQFLAAEQQYRQRVVHQGGDSDEQ